MASQDNETYTQESLHILIADDDLMTSGLLTSFLRKDGHTVVAAENGAIALELFDKDPAFDLFVIDVTMPVMDGLELCSALKGRLQEWVPIIMISANARENDQIQGLDVGADYYITKPICFPLFLAQIRASQRIAALQRELQEKKARLEHYFNRNQADNDLARQLLDGIAHQGDSTMVDARMIDNPAGDFSGDMIVTMTSPVQRLYAFVADATGHGLPAAITLMPAVETFSRLAREGYSLETIVSELNDRLRKSLPADRFLAASVIMIEPHNHAVEVWNGGNPPVYLLDNEHRKITKKFSAQHPPLGILPADEFMARTEQFTHDASQTLVASTDGVVEAENADGEMFGSRRLESLLTDPERSADIVKEIGRALDSYSVADGARDDRTVLVLPLTNLLDQMPAKKLTQQAQKRRAVASQADTETETETGGWYIAIGARGESLRDAELAPLVNGIISQVGITGENADRAQVCLTELINNAVDHGLLKLDSDLKSSPDGFQQFFDERRKRLDALSSGGIFIRAHLDLIRDGYFLSVAVSDSGEGFATTETGDVDEEPSATPFGRGLMLVSKLADKLVFRDGGTTAEFRISVTAHSEDTHVEAVH